MTGFLLWKRRTDGRKASESRIEDDLVKLTRRSFWKALGGAVCGIFARVYVPLALLDSPGTPVEDPASEWTVRFVGGGTAGHCDGADLHFEMLRHTVDGLVREEPTALKIKKGDRISCAMVRS